MENKETTLEQAIVFLEMNAYEGSNAKAVLRMGDVHEVLKPIKGLIDKSAKMESYIIQLERKNKVTIYKGEVMHDLKALFDNAGDYFEDEYELVKQYIEQLEQALDKACEELETFDMTFNAGDFIDVKNKEQWKEWTLQNRK